MPTGMAAGIAHNNLQLDMIGWKAAKASADDILEAQAGEIEAQADLRQADQNGRWSRQNHALRS